jgi:hypothetical protein
MMRSPTAEEGTSEATLLVAAASSSISASIPGTVIARDIGFALSEPRRPLPDGPIASAKLPAARSRRLAGGNHRHPARLHRVTKHRCC